MQADDRASGDPLKELRFHVVRAYCERFLFTLNFGVGKYLEYHEIFYAGHRTLDVFDWYQLPVLEESHQRPELAQHARRVTLREAGRRH